tara:strand:+ start:5196 stop:6680 length:1485 start_codon:yes stop_codon:yes gene_type:complete
MAYNNNKGPQHSGDIQFEGDPNDTQIDFENDSITLKTGGSARVVVNNTGLSGSGTLQSVGPTILGGALSVSGTLTAGNELNTKALFSLGEFTDGFKVTSATAEVFRIDTDASDGNTFFRGKTRIGSHTVAPTATVSVTGDVSGSGALQAVGATTLGNTLSVSGNVNIGGPNIGNATLYVNSTVDNAFSIFKSPSHSVILAITGSGKVAVGGAHLDAKLNVTGSDSDILISAKSNTQNPAFKVEGNGNASASGNLSALHVSASLGITGSDARLISNSPTLFLSSAAGTGLGTMGFNSSNNIVIQNDSNNRHIVFKASDGGVIKEGLRLDGNVPEVVVNEQGDGGTLVDFRVESDNNTHMFYVKGARDAVGINTNAPSHTLEVTGSFLLSGSARSSYTNRPQAGGYTILDTDNVVIFNNASGQTATLPRITTSNQGTMCYIKNIGGGAVTLTGSATYEQFIDGLQTLSLTQGDSAKVIGHRLGAGFGWSVLSYYNV